MMVKTGKADALFPPQHGRSDVRGFAMLGRVEGIERPPSEHHYD